MDHAKFKEHLALYGAEIGRWPEVLRKEAQPHLADPAYAATLKEERAFEALARQRLMLEDAPDFAERILAFLPQRRRQLSFAQRLSVMIGEIAALFPVHRPAYALASLAVIAFVSGAALAPEAASENEFSFLYEEESFL